MKLIFVRYGSAVLLSEFGEKPVSIGDVVRLGANTLYLERDYVIDQVFWQYYGHRPPNVTA